jgi:uncharacterized protein YjiS (DUF1127 family)
VPYPVSRRRRIDSKTRSCDPCSRAPGEPLLVEYRMAPRAHWKGYLKLSLVSCPIALHPAIAAAERISFRQVNRQTGNRLRQQRACARHVAWRNGCPRNLVPVRAQSDRNVASGGVPALGEITLSRELTMCALIHKWREAHRYRSTLRQLNRLSTDDLRSLWITPAEVDRLALHASRS